MGKVMVWVGSRRTSEVYSSIFFRVVGVGQTRR